MTYEINQDKLHDQHHRPNRGPHGGMREGGHRGGFYLQDIADQDPTIQILFIGSVSCTRHKPLLVLGKLMRAKRAAILCPSMADFSSGRYLRQVVEAIAELSEERKSKKFLLIHGCQWVILSSDAELIKQQLKEEYDIELTIKDDSHLVYGDHE